MACETVDGSGTCHDAERSGGDAAPGFDVPDGDDVEVGSLEGLSDIVGDFATGLARLSCDQRETWDEVAGNCLSGMRTAFEGGGASRLGHCR